MNKSKINIRRAPYALMLCALLAGCSDEKYDINLDPIEEPMDVAMAEYVNGFDVLKKYIDFESHPGFRLGASVSSTELMKRGAAGIILHSNFTETMPDDNIMTMGACLGNGGEFDFGNVESYLKCTQEYGLSTFGRSLVWHRSQNADYLNQLIAPVIIEDPNVGAANTGYCLVFENQTAGSNPWDAQVWYEHYTNFESGAKYTLKFMARASGVWSPEVYLQGGEQQYPGPFTVTTQWQEINYTFTSSHGEANKIAINFGQYVGKMYIDNISLKKEGSDDELMRNGDFENASIDQWHAWNGDLYHLSTDSEGYSEIGPGANIIEKTPEEKAEILTGVMEQWIAGVMEVSKEYVSSWIVVEDPMSDTSPVELRKADGDVNGAPGVFLWSDYLGENYVREAVRIAREHGGDNLKLFVSEYGLESAGLIKCQGLISQIEKWESDGVTKIDGIDVKLNLTCSNDPITQKGYEDAIEQMFVLLAKTGKIIRISNLTVSMANATSTNTDIELAKGNYYNFVLRKYQELIPAELRYGVSFGHPAGLNGIWDSNYNRKASYIGVANGLAGKTNQ